MRLFGTGWEIRLRRWRECQNRLSGCRRSIHRLDGLAAEFVRNQVAAIVAAGGPVSALAAKRVTKTIPIVFTTISDPVKSGLVDGLAHPGGNATGTAGLTSELDRKRLELISQIKPSARVVGVLVNPRRPGVDANLRDIRERRNFSGSRSSSRTPAPRILSTLLLRGSPNGDRCFGRHCRPLLQL